jgi:hypothetical protein
MKNSNRRRAMSRQEKTPAQKLDAVSSYDMPSNVQSSGTVAERDAEMKV